MSSALRRPRRGVGSNQYVDKAARALRPGSSRVATFAATGPVTPGHRRGCRCLACRALRTECTPPIATMPERLVHGTRSWAEIEEAGGLTAGTCLATKPEIAEEYGDCATGNGGLAVIEIDTSLLDPEQFVCDEPSLYEPVDPTLAVSTLERKARRARSRLADVGHDGPIGSRWDLSLAAAGTVRYDSPIPLAAIRLVYELDE